MDRIAALFFVVLDLVFTFNEEDIYGYTGDY